MPLISIHSHNNLYLSGLFISTASLWGPLRPVGPTAPPPPSLLIHLEPYGQTDPKGYNRLPSPQSPLGSASQGILMISLVDLLFCPVLCIFLYPS